MFLTTKSPLLSQYLSVFVYVNLLKFIVTLKVCFDWFNTVILSVLPIYIQLINCHHLTDVILWLPM